MRQIADVNPTQQEQVCGQLTHVLDGVEHQCPDDQRQRHARITARAHPGRSAQGGELLGGKQLVVKEFRKSFIPLTFPDNPFPTSPLSHTSSP